LVAAGEIEEEGTTREADEADDRGEDVTSDIALIFCFCGSIDAHFQKKGPGGKCPAIFCQLVKQTRSSSLATKHSTSLPAFLLLLSFPCFLSSRFFLAFLSLSEFLFSLPLSRVFHSKAFQFSHSSRAGLNYYNRASYSGFQVVWETSEPTRSIAFNLAN
jgi:hypothetical protein